MTCYTEESNFSSLLTVDCDETINYETSETYPGHSPIYFVKVNIHFMLTEDINNPGNFTETNDGDYPSPSSLMNGYIFAENMIDEANAILASNELMKLPCPNTTPNVEIRYRYIIAGDANPSVPGVDGIYFHRDDDKYWFDFNDPTLYGSDHSADVLLPESPLGYGYNIDSEINIFLQERNVPNSDKHITGFASLPPSFSGSIANKPFAILGNAWYKYKVGLHVSSYSKLLNHEIGHDLGLKHSWDGGDACSDTPNNNNCWSLDLTEIDCDEDCEISKNIMDYNDENSALTPCQVGIAQYWIITDPIIDYILTDYCEIVDADLIVNAPGQNIIWANRRIMKGNVIVKFGTTLTIKCLLSMPTDSKIIIERGARLVLDGGTITKSCDNLWQGIEVYGAGNLVVHPTRSQIINGTHPMTSASHGVLYIKNGGTIEYARNGITTCKYDDYYNIGYYGGVILAIEGNFVNNKRSVEFLPYNYNNIIGTDDNGCEFYNCTFEANENYLCSESFSYHATMFNVHGVDFLGCKFIDDKPVHLAMKGASTA